MQKIKALLIFCNTFAKTVVLKWQYSSYYHKYGAIKSYSTGNMWWNSIPLIPNDNPTQIFWCVCCSMFMILLCLVQVSWHSEYPFGEIWHLAVMYAVHVRKHRQSASATLSYKIGWAGCSFFNICRMVMFTIPAGKASTCTKQCMETTKQEKEMEKKKYPNFTYEESSENRKRKISGSIPEPYRPK